MAEDSKDSKDPGRQDVVLVHGRTSDGQGLRALRARAERLELAELRPSREGQPLQPNAELVRLRPRQESPLLFDVDVEYRAEAMQSGHEGPARISSPEYRENWEAIFGKRPRRETLPN